MYPELWLDSKLARERQREMLELAMRSAKRGIGDEYLASDPRPGKARKGYLYVGHRVLLVFNWVRRHMTPDVRASA